MKEMRIIGLLIAFFFAAVQLFAQGGIAAESVRLVRQADSVQLSMRLDLSYLEIDKREILLVAPRIVTDIDTLNLPTVGIYGTYPYYYYIRSGHRWLQGPRDIMLRAAKRMKPLDYVVNTPYQAWMDSARVELTFTSNEYCEGAVSEISQSVWKAQQQIIPGRPRLEMLTHAASGRAYIDFVVNQVDIRPDYHRNRRELDKINQTLDSVTQDTANHLLGITIKGYASPEGLYEKNEWLAKNRSLALSDYVAQSYGIPRQMIRSEYEPEDWVGLRDYVNRSRLPHRTEILSLIDQDLPPDYKLGQIQRRFPKDYADIRDNSLPYLRHSDYKIEYRRLTRIEREGEKDTIWALPERALKPLVAHEPLKPYRPLFALKTNLFFDLLATPNFEIEVPFGTDQRWSIMAEDWFPWYVWHHNSRAYELWTVGVELRKWFARCPGSQPVLSGKFIGGYVQSGKYDIEWNSVGDQGEFISFGGTIGYAWPIGKHWNLEASASAGVVFGPQRHYHGEFSDTHLIWKENRHFFYGGPTKLKFSLVWLIGKKLRKGGER